MIDSTGQMSMPLTNPQDPWALRLITAIKAARAAREVLNFYFGRLEKISEKFQAGLVSEADQEAEKAVLSVLKAQYPEDHYLGEESFASGSHQYASSEKGQWIIDPLDGTTNYIHRFPVFAVSIGYVEKGVVHVAVLDVPKLGEVYTAIKGRGAYLNGQKISVSQTNSLSEGLLATGFFNQNEDALKEQLQIFSRLVRQTRGIRRAGAAAYDLAMVARGSFDGFWEKNLKAWDVAAGILLVQEAGGFVSDYQGIAHNVFDSSLVASNGKIHNQIIDSISSRDDSN